MPRTKLNMQIERIKEDILKMTEFVSEELKNSIIALSSLDNKLATDVIDKDKIVNEFRTSIKERCIQTIALQQPVAKDLRFISISIDVASNLERVGDYSVDIAEGVRHILKEYPEINGKSTQEVLTFLEPIHEEKDLIIKMANLAATMVNKSGKAFINKDKNEIEEIMKSEEEVNSMFGEIFRKLEEISKKDSEKIPFALNLILIARHLERIADHAVNIADRTMYAIEGREEFV